jgi:hypothetical protein
MHNRKFKKTSLKPFQFYRATISFKSNQSVAPDLLIATKYAEYIAQSHYEAIQSARRYSRSIRKEGIKLRTVVGIKVAIITLNEIDNLGNMQNKEKYFYQWQDKKRLNGRSLLKI